MRKLGITAGTTAEFTLRDLAAAGSRQASVTDDNQPKTSTNDDDEALDRVMLPPADTSISYCLFIYVFNEQ